MPRYFPEPMAAPLTWRERFLREVTLIPGDVAVFPVDEYELRMRPDGNLPPVKELCARAGRPGLERWLTDAALAQDSNARRMLFNLRIGVPRGAFTDLAPFGPHSYRLGAVGFTDSDEAIINEAIINVVPQTVEYLLKLGMGEIGAPWDLVDWPKVCKEFGLQPRSINMAGGPHVVMLGQEGQWAPRSRFSSKQAAGRFAFEVRNVNSVGTIGHRFDLAPYNSSASYPERLSNSAYMDVTMMGDSVVKYEPAPKYAPATPPWEDPIDGGRRYSPSSTALKPKRKKEPTFQAPAIVTSRKIIFEDE